MDTRFLETFLLVVDNGSIAAAARQLNVTPAAVAQRIRALEDEVGFALIMRSGRTVSTTESGAAMVGRVRDVLLQLRELRTPLEQKAVAGELHIGAISTAITGFLPTILSQLSTRHPDVDVHVQPGTSAILYQQVLTGELDAAIIAQPPFDPPKSCEWKVLYSEELVLLKPQSVEGNDVRALLRENPFIRYDGRVWGGLLVDGYLKKIGARPQERFELDALDAIAVLVDRGLGVALVPDWPPPWPAGISIAKIPVGDPAFDRHIGLVWARANPRLRLVKAFLEEMDKEKRARANAAAGKTTPRLAIVR